LAATEKNRANFSPQRLTKGIFQEEFREKRRRQHFFSPKGRTKIRAKSW